MAGRGDGSLVKMLDLKNLQHSYSQKNWPEVQGHLSQAMLHLSALEASLDPSTQSQSQQVYEIGAFTALAAKDQASFDRYISLLSPLYFDKGKTVEQATDANCNVLLGLYLLSLLVRNHIAEFHVTLERINSAPGLDISNVYIQFPVQLQQCLVEGTFHRVVLARQQVPSPDYAWFIDSLVETIRNELAACLEKSFKSIDLASAARLLLLAPEQASSLTKFAEQRGWHVKNGNEIVFASTSQRSDDLVTLSRELMIQTMSYARELEEII